MDYIDFDILSKLFKHDFSFGRTFGRGMDDNAGNPMYLRKKNMCSFIPADWEVLENIDREISNGMEQKITMYLDSCPATSWPIILKRYLEQITQYCENAKRTVYIFNEVDTSDSESLVGTPYEDLDKFKSLYKAGELEENSKYSLLICSMALSIVKDIADRYCPGNKDLEKLFPESFSEPAEVEQPEEPNELEKEMETNRKFQFIIQRAKKLKWLDSSCYWKYPGVEPTKLRRFYGSLCWFISYSMSKAGLINSTRWDLHHIFPNTGDIVNGKIVTPELTQYLSKFRREQSKFNESAYMKIKQEIDLMCLEYKE